MKLRRPRGWSSRVGDARKRLGRFVRTVATLHPVQIAARLPHAVVSRLLFAVPGSGAPRPRERWPPPPAALLSAASGERDRGRERIARLSADTRLCAYEAHYGLELGPGDHRLDCDDRARVALAPFPASVRARRLAVAIRCGGQGLATSLARAARAVSMQLEFHLLGNHLLENGLALACAGAATSGAEADAWFALGVAILSRQLRQFSADGGHFERSASYHLALTHALLETIELAEASGRGASSLWRSTAARALGFAAAIRAPDGDYPLFNDAALDAAPSIDTVAALGRALGILPIALPLSGGVDAWVRRLEPTGWVTCGVNDSWLALDAGPDGAGYQPGHAHADGLTFELWVGGVRAVVDYGVASYASGAARAESRSTRAHNTIEVDGLDSCEVWGAFRLGRRGRGTADRVAVGDRAVDLEVGHDGYRWLAGAPRLGRKLHLRAGALEIEDRVESVGSPHSFVTRLRLDGEAAAGLRVTGSASIERYRSAWFPRHGDTRDAVVLEQRGRAGEPVRWMIEWIPAGAHLK